MVWDRRVRPYSGSDANRLLLCLSMPSPSTMHRRWAALCMFGGPKMPSDGGHGRMQRRQIAKRHAPKEDRGSSAISHAVARQPAKSTSWKRWRKRILRGWHRSVTSSSLPHSVARLSRHEIQCNVNPISTDVHPDMTHRSVIYEKTKWFTRLDLMSCYCRDLRCLLFAQQFLLRCYLKSYR